MAANTHNEPLAISGLNSFVLGIRNDTPSEDAYLFLHGFPAEKGDKNRDITIAVNKATYNDAYLLHYKGLGGAKGYFQFSDSIRESIEVAKELIKQNQYRKLHLVGHSWGGLIALNVQQELGSHAGRLILLSPLNLIPNKDALKIIIKSILIEHPTIFGTQSIDDVLADIDLIREKHHPRDLAKNVTVNGFIPAIIQALEDDEVPPETTREFAKLFPIQPKYIELKQDHSFLNNRAEIINTILSVL